MMPQQQKAFWIQLSCLLSLVCGQSSSPFLAAEQGLLPQCQIYGRTYCLDIDAYPT